MILLIPLKESMDINKYYSTLTYLLFIYVSPTLCNYCIEGNKRLVVNKEDYHYV